MERNPGILLTSATIFSNQGLQLFEIRLWLHVGAKDDDDHLGTPLQLGA